MLDQQFVDRAVGAQRIDGLAERGAQEHVVRAYRDAEFGFVEWERPAVRNQINALVEMNK